MQEKKLQITILVDHNVKTGLTGEHGFSAWIETSGHRILFDTGQGIALMPNAAILGCNVRQAGALVLSHGHYDHTGGIADVLEQNPGLAVFGHPDTLLPRYSIRDHATPKEISMSAVNRSAILSLPPERFRRVMDMMRIYSDVGLSGPIPRTHPLEDTGGPFFLDPEGTHPDPLRDDIAMWVETERGLVILTGCCHSGLINTVDHVRQISGQGRVSAVVGGFHLLHASRRRLEATCRALKEWNVDTVIPCHCTGDEAAEEIQKQLGERVIPGYAGLAWRP